MDRKLVPDNFAVPDRLETDRFRLRMLTVDDAEIYMWVRTSELKSGLDGLLYKTIKEWIKEVWPFRNPVYPGREISWNDWDKM